MNYIKHNDYEILCQIKEGNQEALELMFGKYKALISKIIYRYNLYYDFDDMFQEGQMILYKSIMQYDEAYNKTFTRFFEQNLERKYITIIGKRVRRKEIFNKNILYIYETNNDLRKNSPYFEMLRKEIAKILTNTENLVYNLRELQNFSISYIKENSGLGEKEIYNSLHRAKMKIKKHFKN